MSTTQDFKTTFKYNIICIFLSLRAQLKKPLCPLTPCTQQVFLPIFEFDFSRQQNFLPIFEFLSGMLILPKISSNIPDKNSKIGRKFYYLEKMNSKIGRKTYYLQKLNSKNGRKFYYSQKLCFDRIFEIKKMEGNSTTPQNCVLTFFFA